MFNAVAKSNQEIQLNQVVAPVLEAAYIGLRQFRDDFVSMLGRRIEEGAIRSADSFLIKLGQEETLRRLEGRIPVQSNIAEKIAQVIEPKYEKNLKEQVPSQNLQPPPEKPTPPVRANSKQQMIEGLENKSSLARFALDKAWS